MVLSHRGAQGRRLLCFDNVRTTALKIFNLIHAFCDDFRTPAHYPWLAKLRIDAFIEVAGRKITPTPDATVY